MRKLAVVVGHNSRSQGAVRQDNGESEFVYHSRMAAYMAEVAHEYDLDVKVFFRKAGRGYSREIREVYAETDRWGADATVELHFNAAGDPRASGTETLSSGSSKSVELAQSVQMELVEELGLRDRGVKVRNSRTKGRGYLSLVSGRAPAILTEPFFATSSKGLAASDTSLEQQRIAEAILEGVRKASL